MGKKSVKVIFGILIGIFVFANVFLLNVVLHEAGHYWATEHYALEPEIAFNFENITGAGFSFKSIPIAYTSFLDNGNLYEMGVIALMGPFVNLLLGILFMLVFGFSKERFYLKGIVLMCVMISIGSSVMNLIPIRGTDGYLILRMFN